MPKMDYVSTDKRVCLKIPYVSEFVSYEILRYIKKRKLPINVIFVPGTKLRDILCSSRPLDKPGCSLPHCKICDLLEDDVNCNTSRPVYQIKCGLCNELYIGERVVYIPPLPNIFEFRARQMVGFSLNTFKI